MNTLPNTPEILTLFGEQEVRPMPAPFRTTAHKLIDEWEALMADMVELPEGLTITEYASIDDAGEALGVTFVKLYGMRS